MNETTLTLTGNLADAPELRFTPSGVAVARFRIASTPRYRDGKTGEWKDGDSLFLTCQAWRAMAENVAESLDKGMRVIVTGRLRQRSYEARDGGTRTRVRARGRRGRAIAEERGREGDEGLPDRRRERRLRPGRHRPVGL